MQASYKPGLRLSWKPFRAIRPGGFPGHPILGRFKPVACVSKYAALLFHGNLGHLGKPFPWMAKRFVKELYVGKY